MTEIFGTLEDVEPRTAWIHESQTLTPWLAANLDRLSKEIGIPLELIETEARVGTFAADIIARDTASDRIVLIENQLEVSDHTHLGQILTYLAGLDSQVIIWIAPRFRDPHLSAIRWLNEHTNSKFAFFAVKLRVVRIGASPLAPLFEVLERPNDWDRLIEQATRASSEDSAAAVQRREFWANFGNRNPSLRDLVSRGGSSSKWVFIDGSEFVISMWLAKDDVGVFIRGGRGVPSPEVAQRLQPYEITLREKLGVPLANPQYPFLKRLAADTSDRNRWDELADWLARETEHYREVVLEIWRTLPE